VSAALTAPLPADEVAKLIAGLDGPAVSPAYRRLVAAQLDEAAGETDSALDQYLAVAVSGNELPPAALGTAEVGAARCLAALLRFDEARAHAVAAQEVLTRWSGWRVDQLRSVQGLLGLQESSSPAAALTPREREVALLIAEGLTNADLARRLYISPRTAAVHVSAILRKLGVSSRTEVGAALANH
jgi:DNA-binding NarL/FixJ family response regulator